MLDNEPLIRLAVFSVVFAAMALWEWWWPRRQAGYPLRLRWPNNLGLLVLNTALVRVVFPTTAVGVALSAEQAGWGLFHSVDASWWVAVVGSVVLLDLAIYVQHVLFHYVPWLWRLHRVHHADLDFDATTGLRFHPVEILISMVLKFAVIAALGAPALAVLLFEVLLNSTSIFNHANAALPSRLDRALRWIVVTPDMHRVHHSVIPTETNSNFGFNLSWWDRLFGTYRDQPADGHESMTIGISEFSDPRELRIDHMLVQPLR